MTEKDTDLEKLPVSTGEAAWSIGSARYVRNLRSMLRRDPNSIEALDLLARHYYADREDYASSIKYAERAVSLDSTHISAHITLATALSKLDRRFEAVEAILQATNLFNRLPADASVMHFDSLRMRLLVARWRVFNLSGMHIEALAAAREGQERDQPGLWRGKVLHSLVQLSRMQEAEWLYGQDGQAYRQALWDIAFALVDLGRVREAASYFRRRYAFARLPQDSELLFANIECLLLAGEYEEGGELSQFWLSQQMFSAQERRLLNTYAGICYERMGNVVRAAEYLSRGQGRMSEQNFLRLMERDLLVLAHWSMPLLRFAMDSLS